MERIYKLLAPLACLHEAEDLPAGTLVIGPRNVGADDYVFLGGTDGGQTWREYRTIIEDRREWFELVAAKGDETS